MKRYDLDFATEYSDAKEIKESTNGDWVKWDDVKPYVVEIARTRNRLRAIYAYLGWWDDIESMRIEGWWDDIKSMGIEDV